MEIQILDSKGKRYISEVLIENNMTDLPDNVILNKITTGSGMTSCALSNNIPYVVCVPKRNLILNKVKWCEDKGINIIGVYSEKEGGASVEEILAFKGDKILTTYDSLHKVVNALTSNGRIGDFKIMIDEAHELIKAGNYRYGAVDNVLNNYTKFKSFIFGTATPVDDKYQHPKLKDIQKVQIKWDNLEPVTVNYCRYEDNLLKATAIAAIKHLTGEISNNAHFFINSVNDIVSIIRNIKKGGFSDPTSIRIITANSDVNDYKLIQGLGKGYSIDSINSSVKKINFYTSTAFEGVDIYDEEALTYIISDGSKNHSKIDVLITLPQIIGRIRNSKITNYINLLYSPNKYYSHTTEAEFEYYTKKQLEAAKTYVDRYNNESIQMIKDGMLKGADDNIYLRLTDNNDLILNDTALYSEMQNFKTLNTTYYVAKYKKEGTKENTVTVNEIKYTYKPDAKIKIEGLNKATLGSKVNFPMLCEMYNTADMFEKVNIGTIEPIIEEAYIELGFTKLKALKFRKNEIEKELLLNNSIKTTGWKVANLLGLRVGQWISSNDVSSKLTSIYEGLGLDKKVKSTDISNYYIVREASKRVNNIKVKGYTIITTKFKNK